MKGDYTIKLPLRSFVQDDRGYFEGKYKIKKINNIGVSILKSFYFTNDDVLIFTDKPVDLNLREQIYRNDLRRKISEYFKFGFKIREWEMLMRSVYKDKVPGNVADERFLSETFYGRKIARYKAFAKNICDFCLSMVHAYYWEDFQNLMATEKTLRMCVEEVFPFVEKIKDMFEKDLEEEFDTSDIEKELGIGKENKKLAVTSTVDMPPLKVSKK